MAQYTVLNNKDLETILAQYGINEVKSYNVLSGGSENTNYLVKTAVNNYVLTICEQKSIEKTIELANLLEHLSKNNFSTSKIIKTVSNKFITVWNDKPILLKAYIEGDIIEELPDDVLIYVGEELAKLHQIESPKYLSKTVSYGIERFDEVKVYASESEFYVWLKEIQKYIESYISTDLPKALIHSDIFYNNIIINTDDEKATIMDFEEACYYYRVFDIGMMIVGTCCEENKINSKKIKSLLKGYEKEIKLLDVERKALKAFTVYGAVATAFWRHQNFNYVNIIEEKKNHYLAMKNLANSIRELSDSSFL